MLGAVGGIWVLGGKCNRPRAKLLPTRVDQEDSMAGPTPLPTELGCDSSESLKAGRIHLLLSQSRLPPLQAVPAMPSVPVISAFMVHIRLVGNPLLMDISL